MLVDSEINTPEMIENIKSELSFSIDSNSEIFSSDRENPSTMNQNHFPKTNSKPSNPSLKTSSANEKKLQPNSLNLFNPEEDSALNEKSNTLFISETPEADPLQICCRICGFFMVFSFAFIFDMASKGTIFADILMIAATGFIIGFIRQAKDAFNEERRLKTLVLLGSIVVSFVLANFVRITGVSFIFIVLKIGAYIWYIASYIPQEDNLNDSY